MRLFIVTLSVVLLTSCSSDPQEKEPRSTESAGQVSLSTEEVAQHRVKVAFNGLEVGAGDSLNLAYAHGKDLDSVGRYDDDPALRRVVGSRFPNGFIDWVEAAGDQVYYVDQSAEGDTMGTRIRWTINVVDPESGKVTVVQRSSPPGTPILPVPLATDAGLTWIDAEAGFSKGPAEVWFLPAGTTTPRVIHRSNEMGWSPRVQDGFLYYIDYRAHETPTASGFPPADVVRTPMDGSGKTERLTHSGTVRAFDVEGDTLGWDEGRLPDDDHDLDDPYRVWSAHADGSAPTLMKEGANAGNTVAGDGWIAWWDEAGRVVVAPRDHPEAAEVVSVETYVPGRIDAEGDRLVFAEDPTPELSKGEVLIRLLKVVVDEL